MMLVTSGKGLIMGNAPAALKNKLPDMEVIATNHEDGVANYLFDLLLKN